MAKAKRITPDVPAARSAPGRLVDIPLAFYILATTLLAGCVGGPGASPALEAPRLIMNAHGLKQWDRPQAFGPVPNDLLTNGLEYCATLNHGGKRYSPAGYHPHARSVEGFTFEDGGFYCTKD